MTSVGKRYLFLTPPATGELQSIYAIAERLVDNHPLNTVYIASGSTFEPRFETFKASLHGFENLDERLHRVDIGRSDDVEDYSLHMLKKHPSKGQDRFGSHRHERGNPIPFLDYWELFAAGTEEERLATIKRVRSVIRDVKPDLVVVDQIYGTPFDAVRSTGLPFVVVAPGHPSFAIDANPLTEPMSMSGTVWKGSLRDILSNFMLTWRLVVWILWSPWARTTLKLRRWTLSFEWLSIGADSNITPPPAAVKEVAAAISCNVENLHFYHQSHPKVTYTGPLSRLSPKPTGRDQSQESQELLEWLDEAQSKEEAVVFISFGSMFPFTPQDYLSMVTALRRAHAHYPHFIVLWKIVRTDQEYHDIAAPFIRECSWLPSVTQIYEHPATKIVVHHGGGNTVNEVIWHGLSHLVIPQWSDTYDWGATIEGFHLGLQTQNPGPELDSSEIEKHLLHLLQRPRDFQDAINYWQRRSRESGGTSQAAAIIEEQARLHQDAYQRWNFKDKII